MCLAMHLEVHPHGMKAGTIQCGPVHELCQTLPALTGQQLQPRCEVFGADCFSRQAAVEPLGGHFRIVIPKCMDRHGHHGSICLSAVSDQYASSVDSEIVLIPILT